MILYAKSIGASSTVLGVIASFTPLMTVFQLPAAQFLPRYGYRRFILMGWSLRAVLIFIVAIVPLLSFLGTVSLFALLLSGLFLFNLIRGISSCAVLPWITELIPEAVRGRFLSRDQFGSYLGAFVAMIVSAFVMRGSIHEWHYSLIFFFSAVTSTAGLYFMKRIPDVHPASEAVRKSATRVPWRTMLSFPPFARLLGFNMLFMFTIGGLSVFTVEYLEEFPKLSPSLIMGLSSLSFVAALVSLPLTGRLIDALGSKLVLRVALAVYGLTILGWLAMAGGELPPRVEYIVILNFMAGLAGANFNLANVRMTMSTIPIMGRNHFFALFTVVTSLGLGAAPIFWGIALDAFGALEVHTHFITWRRHSIYFAAILVLNILSFLAVRYIQEGKETIEEATLLEARLRRLSRLTRS